MALSDLLGPALQLGSTILGVGNAIARGNAMRAIGARRRASAEFEAAQLRLAAEEASGAGLRAAQDETLRAQTVNSTALARAAASGAGASDPTVMSILARTGAEGAYRSAVAMYQGESQARLDRLRAAAASFDGETSSQDASMSGRLADMTAVNTLLSGGVKGLSMYERFFPNEMKPDSSVKSEAKASGAWLDAGTDIGNYG